MTIETKKSGLEILGTIGILVMTFLFSVTTVHAQESCDLVTFNNVCKIGCPNGYEHDENGCPVCECSVGNSELLCASNMTCPQRCEDYRTDDGCVTCECSNSDYLAEENIAFCDLSGFSESCEIGCPYGYKHDDDGCPVCACNGTHNPHCAPSAMCPQRCEDYYLDDDGCTTCECSDPEAVDELKLSDGTCDMALFSSTCEVGCPYGYSHDNNGCPICDCAEPNPAVLDDCGSVYMCPVKCEDYMVDDDGCVTCDCSDTI